MTIIAFRLHLAPVTPQMLNWTFLKQEKIQNNFQAPQPDSMEVKSQLQDSVVSPRSQLLHNGLSTNILHLNQVHSSCQTPVFHVPL